MLGLRMKLIKIWCSTLHNLQAPCTVIFVYGGAWSSGDKRMYGLLARELASPRFDGVENVI